MKIDSYPETAQNFPEHIFNSKANISTDNFRENIHFRRIATLITLITQITLIIAPICDRYSIYIMMSQIGQIVYTFFSSLT